MWRQKQERVEAHILVCFLSYVLWKTLAQFCLRAGLGLEPRKVFEEISRIAHAIITSPTQFARKTFDAPCCKYRCLFFDLRRLG